MSWCSEAKLSLAATDKMEELDWAYFAGTGEWQETNGAICRKPMNDPDDRIKELEKDYWKNMADLFWKLYWVRFSEHVSKYADLPVLENRAMDFLSGMNFNEPDLAKKNTGEISLAQFGDPAYPHARKKGVEGLIQGGVEPVEHFKNGAKAGACADEVHCHGWPPDRFGQVSRKNRWLIDFWATWCKPCVAEMPVLKSVYDKYRDKGFRSDRICLDDESQRAEVKKILEKSGLSAPHSVLKSKRF